MPFSRTPCNGARARVSRGRNGTPVQLHSAAVRTATPVDALLAFHRLVGNLAGRFVNIPPDDVDEAIVDCQRQIVETLGLDRSALFQISDEDLAFTHA